MSSTSFGKLYTVLLLAPLAVVAAFALSTATVVWLDPAAGISERGDEGLLHAALISTLVELALLLGLG